MIVVEHATQLQVNTLLPVDSVVHLDCQRLSKAKATFLSLHRRRSIGKQVFTVVLLPFALNKTFIRAVKSANIIKNFDLFAQFPCSR